MKLYYWILCAALLFLVPARVRAALLISEICPGTSGNDWVELFYCSEERSSLDIASFYVTMYYGQNEQLARQSIHLYSYNRTVTPYDDRFAVIHLTDSTTPDETDLTGDTNRNGRIDIYCNNYYASLWNTECVVALDTNDNPLDGMRDFAAYSNRDGSLHASMASYIESAITQGEWQQCAQSNLQYAAIPIPADGLESYQSMCRQNSIDTNSLTDFCLTSVQTPGSPNIITSSTGKKGALFTLSKKRIIVVPGHTTLAHAQCRLLVNQPSSIRMRIFTDLGRLLYETPLYKNVAPGSFSLCWDYSQHRRVRTGLYIAYIEAHHTSQQWSTRKKIVFIVSRYR